MHADSSECLTWMVVTKRCMGPVARDRLCLGSRLVPGLYLVGAQLTAEPVIELLAVLVVHDAKEGAAKVGDVIKCPAG